jgi:ABC-type tungstate transport system permease subunit
MSDTNKSAKDKIEQGLPRLKEGLPHQAFAIVGDKDDPDTWKLPHHTNAIFRAIQGKIGHYRTTDWEHCSAAVAALSRGGFRGKRVEATEQQILDAAKHLARHYSENGKPVPDTLAALVE